MGMNGDELVNVPDLGKFIDWVHALKEERDQLRAALSRSGDKSTGHCSDWLNCFCGGDTQRVRESCSNWVKWEKPKTVPVAQGKIGGREPAAWALYCQGQLFDVTSDLDTVESWRHGNGQVEPLYHRPSAMEAPGSAIGSTLRGAR